MKTRKDNSVAWGHFGPKSTYQAVKSGPDDPAPLLPLGPFAFLARLFALRQTIDSSDMVRARKDASELMKRGLSTRAPVAIAILAEMMAEIEVNCDRYHVAEKLLRDTVIPGYREMPACVSKRARRSLQTLYFVRDNKKRSSAQ